MEEIFDQLRHDLVSKMLKVPKTQAEIVKEIGISLQTLWKFNRGETIQRVSRVKITQWLNKDQ